MAGTDHTAHDHSGRDTTHTDTVRADTVRADTVRTDAVRTDGDTVTRGAGRDAVAAQHARFGGIKWGAAFFGWLSANGLAVILIAMLSAGGVALGLAQNVDTANEAANKASEIGIGGGIAVLVVLFLAYLAGGYVAGRMARFDGVRQGLAVWLVGLIIVIVLAAAGAVLGAKYNVLKNLNLPRIPVDEGTATTAGIITLVAILLVTLLGAVLGGKLGDRFHRRVDRAGFDAV
jgi:MFS family permease